MEKQRATSIKELDDVIRYWSSMPRCSGHYDKNSLIQFLHIFTPSQIKGAMFIATSKGRPNYFRYLCGILHNWRKEIEQGKAPLFFDVDDKMEKNE